MDYIDGINWLINLLITAEKNLSNPNILPIFRKTFSRAAAKGRNFATTNKLINEWCSPFLVADLIRWPSLWLEIVTGILARGSFRQHHQTENFFL